MPRRDLSVCSQCRLPIEIPRWQRMLGAIVAPLIRRRLQAHYDQRLKHVVTLIDSLRRCETRDSLESLFGPPRYAIDPQVFSEQRAGGLGPMRPDAVEVYEKDGCLIELWFKDENLYRVVGAVNPTRWEIVTRAVGGSS